VKRIPFRARRNPALLAARKLAARKLAAVSLIQTSAGIWRPQRLRAGAAALGRAALDALFPPICLACRAATGAHGALCPACWRAMRFIERPFCERLGTPFEQDLGEGLLSPQAIADPPVFRRARAVARFEDGPARRLVHRLKYSDRGDLARPLGAWMARAGADVLAEADVIVPVPLHRLRLWRRRFNQAAALAQGVAAASGKRFEPRWLERVKPTRSQVGLTREQRAQNMQGAFRVAPAAPLRGARVVLIDDVLTSGATANAAARALLRGGAAEVDLIVFARVVTGA
jgi:ComF family protein